jgi:hypothetical protein
MNTHASGLQPLSEAELDQLAERLDRIPNEKRLAWRGWMGCFAR